MASPSITPSRPQETDSIRLGEIISGQLPDEVIEIIMHHTESQYLRTRNSIVGPPPIEILQIATVNKRFRTIASRLAGNTLLWSPRTFPPTNDSQIINCPYLSASIDQPVSFPSPNECTDRPCRDIHSSIAWFSFAIPSITTFDHSLFWERIPSHEAMFLIGKLVISNTKIRKLRIGSFANDTFETDPLQQKSIRMIFEKFAPNIHKLRVRLSSLMLSKLLLGYRFSGLRKFCIELHDAKMMQNIDITISIIKHCTGFAENLKTLKLDIGEDCFLVLPRIQEACPNLTRLHIVVPLHQSHSVQFLSLEDLMTLRISELCIEGWTPLDGNFCAETFVEYATNNRSLYSIEFKTCDLPFLGPQLERHGVELGRKIKRISTLPLLTPRCSFMRQVARFCPNIERLCFSAQKGDAEHLRTFLRKSTVITEVNIEVARDYTMLTEELNQVIRGLEDCAGTIDSFSIHSVVTSPEKVIKLLDCFNQKLVKLVLWFSQDLDVPHFKGLKTVLTHLVETRKFSNLQTLSLELMSEVSIDAFYSTFEDNFDGQELQLIGDCKRLVTILESHCPEFDGAAFCRAHQLEES